MYSECPKFLTFSKELSKKEILEQAKIAAVATDCVAPETIVFDKNIMTTREEAEKYLVDKAGEVDAVKYLKYVTVPEEAKTERYKAAVERHNEAVKHYNELVFAPLGADGRVSSRVGCKKCGSLISVEYLSGGACPVCGNDLRNAQRRKSIDAAFKRLKASEQELEEASQYYVAKLKKYGEWNWLIRVEPITEIASVADALLSDSNVEVDD